MQLIGLMLARNEDWVIGLSARVALRWVDQLVVLDHSSTDRTPEILRSVESEMGRVSVIRWDDPHKWDEMSAREATLKRARELGATHCAIIDADEVLTFNALPRIRNMVEALRPGQVLDVAMIPVWGNLASFRNDSSVWSRSWVSLGFADHPELSWKPAEDGYHHHHRMPYGVTQVIKGGRHGDHGVMHLQFANRRRLVAKHVLYRMVDHLRWPGRDSVATLNTRYDEALESPAKLSPCPKPEWWGDYDFSLIHLDGVPWQEAEIDRLLAVHARRRFRGLDLKGR